MSGSDSPYVFRGEEADDTDGFDESRPTEGQEVVIVDGRAMSFRWYRR